MIVTTLPRGNAPRTLPRPFTPFKEELMGRSRYIITEPNQPQ